MSVITVLLPLFSDKSLFAYLKEWREKEILITEIQGAWWRQFGEYRIQLIGRKDKRAHLVSDESLEKAAKYIENCESKLDKLAKNKTFRFHYKDLGKIERANLV